MVQETRKPRLEPRDEWGRTPRKLVAPYQCRKTLPFHNLGGSVDALLEVNPLTRQQWIRAQSRCDRQCCAFFGVSSPDEAFVAPRGRQAGHRAHARACHPALHVPTRAQALGTAAPVGDVIVPESVPPIGCAYMDAAHTSRRTTAGCKNRLYMKFTKNPLSGGYQRAARISVQVTTN